MPDPFRNPFIHAFPPVPTRLQDPVGPQAPLPKEGDIVREKKYAQPLEVTRVDPPHRRVEVKPQDKPATQPKWFPAEELQPYKKE